MAKIIGEALKNIPWQDKPENCKMPVWRYTENPIIERDALPKSNSIFNSAVVPFKGGFAGIFRVDLTTREQKLVTGFSDDGIHWQLNNEYIYDGYDPRICEMDGYYYLSWVKKLSGSLGTVIGIARTTDFESFEELDFATLPTSRNGVLFPRKVNNMYMLFSRPCDKGHTPYGDMFLSQSPDLTFWGKHHHVISPVNTWEATKVGAGPTPIETDEGWLCFYHGVTTSCNGFTYSMGAMITDINEPWKVLHRADGYLLNPRTEYECMGDVPNVVFPCAALTDSETGRIAIYYGGADTVIALAFCEVNEIIEYIKNNDLLK